VILLDVNVLVAAQRHDHPHHDAVRAWFDGLLEGDEPFGVPDTVWASFVRITTNRRIFPVPTPLPEAFAFLWSVRAQPHHVAVAPTRRHLELFEQVCVDVDATGDLAADAYLAAIAMELACPLVSIDRDFARFPTIEWRLPRL